MIVENVTRIESGITIDYSLKTKNGKNIMCAKKIMFRILLHVIMKMTKYLRSFIYDSMTACDEIIESTKTVPTKCTPTKTVPTKSTSTNFYILLIFSLITIALLIDVSIYCYLTKHRGKPKHLLPYHSTSN